MAIKNQGTQLNRTVTDFFVNADFGAFATTFTSIVLRGDAERKIFITGFSFVFNPAALDINANHALFVALIDSEILNESSTILFPDIFSKLTFMYGNTAPQVANQLSERFENPLHLRSGVTYSLLGIMTLGAAIAAQARTHLTLFGYEESLYNQKETYFSIPR